MNATTTRRTDDRRTFRNEDLVLTLKPHDPARWNESRYEPFLDTLCGHREYPIVGGARIRCWRICNCPTNLPARSI
jgi:hypothetical protein